MEKRMCIRTLGTTLNITTADSEEYINELVSEVEKKIYEAKDAGATLLQSALYAALYFCDKAKNVNGSEKEPEQSPKKRTFENGDNNQEALF